MLISDLLKETARKYDLDGSTNSVKKFNNIPLALDTVNRKAIESWIKVYNSENGKAQSTLADAGPRIEMIDLAGIWMYGYRSLC